MPIFDKKRGKMDKARLEKILLNVRDGAQSVNDALEALRALPKAGLECANLDHHRHLRTDIPEVIFGENKEPDQIVEIASHMLGYDYVVMATRVDPEKAAAVCHKLPGLEYHASAGMLVGNKDKIVPGCGRGVIGVLAAGTTDIPVAEEACLTAECLGHKVERAYDVGIAGIHRLLAHQELLDSASVFIVAAGMEGALPSVVAGLVNKPVLALPTSVGYGTGLGGFAALLAMLNGCAPGVAVLNIDNGFGAGCMAAAINKRHG
jgi:NCAIR mutase (PurE)-related protein